MRYTVRESFVQVVGSGWYGQTMATEYPLREDYDVENMRDDSGNITRESARLWLDKNAGDFQSIYDFRVSISLADGTDIEIDWESQENEFTFNDCMYPVED